MTDYRALLGGRPRQPHRRARGLGAGPGHEPAAVGQHLPHPRDEPTLLVGVEQRRLPRRPRDHEAIEALLDEARHVAPEMNRREVARGAVERRREGGEHAPELLLRHEGGSRLDRSSLKPARFSTAPAGGPVRNGRRSVRICSSKSAGFEAAASAVS